MRTAWRSLGAAMCFVALVSAVHPAGAAEMIDASRPEDILNLARGYGSASMDKADSGDPMIRGRIDGTAYVIFFNDCTDNRDCLTLGFYAAWTDTDVSDRQIADWNRDKRFSRAYIDADGDPVIEFDVNLRFGVSRSNLDDTIDWWKTVMLDFRNEVVAAAAE